MGLAISAQGRAALVNGVGLGYGPGIAAALAQAGANVAVNFDSADRAAKTVAAIQAQGRKGLSFKADVRDRGQVEDMLKKTVAAFGKLDILVDNDRFLYVGVPLADTPLVSLRQLVERHALGPYQLTQLALPYLRQNPRADVIYISTRHTHPLSQPEGRTAQVLSLAALEYMARVLAKEEILNGIRVNVICPGMSDGDALKGTPMEGREEELARFSPFNRFCTGEDIGNLCAFLVSDQCQYLTGQTIYVDGGGRRPEWGKKDRSKEKPWEDRFF